MDASALRKMHAAMPLVGFACALRGDAAAAAPRNGWLWHSQDQLLSITPPPKVLHAVKHVLNSYNSRGQRRSLAKALPLSVEVSMGLLS